MFEYNLPEHQIAQRPSAEPKLLDARSESFETFSYGDLPGLLAPGDLLVLNNTRVEPVRLKLKRQTGGSCEIFLIEQIGSVTWKAIGKPLKKLKPGDVLYFEEKPVIYVKRRLEDDKLEVDLNKADIHKEIGKTPIPPYIRGGDSDEADRKDYQTVYAEVPGSIAAPTAGLKFTREILTEISAAGVDIGYLTLHVGEGSIRLNADKVYPERYSVSSELVSKIKKAERVVAVGTTVVRALESFWLGELPADMMHESSLFITPGFEFKVVDGLITNFHQSGSTHLKLVCAFSGEERIKKAYSFALDENYRFLSYGDGMFISRS